MKPSLTPSSQYVFLSMEHSYPLAVDTFKNGKMFSYINKGIIPHLPRLLTEYSLLALTRNAVFLLALSSNYKIAFSLTSTLNLIVAI